MSPEPLITIIADTREQTPHHDLDGIRCHYLTHGLSIGDYALAEDCRQDDDGICKTYKPLFAVERKSVADLIGTVMIARNWSREMRNNVRPAREQGFSLQYFIDGNERDILDYDYSRFINATAWNISL